MRIDRYEIRPGAVLELPRAFMPRAIYVQAGIVAAHLETHEVFDVELCQFAVLEVRDGDSPPNLALYLGTLPPEDRKRFWRALPIYMVPASMRARHFYLIEVKNAG